MNGIVIVNQTIGHNQYKIERFKKEFSKKGVHLDVFVNDGTLAEIKNNEIKINLPAANFVLYLDKDIYLARLLEKAGKVVVIELDDKMIPVLEDRFQLYENFELIHDDILKVNLKELMNKNLKGTIQQVKIVANLPYYITTPIIMKLLEEKLPIDSITVMVQKEVAQRLTAIPGTKNTGAITYTVYYYAEADSIIRVPKDSFFPEPKVDSEVIQLKIREMPPVVTNNEKILFKLIKQAFMQRRKTLVNSLEHSGLFQQKQEIVTLLQKLNINEKVRGEALSLEQFAKIANLIEEKQE